MAAIHPLLNQSMPNLFHKFEQVVEEIKEESEIRGHGPHSINFHSHCSNIIQHNLDNVATVSCNLYMLLEFMHWHGIKVANSDTVVDKLCQIKKDRKWGKVHPQFLDNLFLISPDSVHVLKDNTDITSGTDSVCTVSENVTIKRNFFSKKVTNTFKFVTTSSIQKFEMKLPRQSTCDKDSVCGFLIEVTGTSSENQFDIKLILDDAKYADTDMHHHAVSADRMHVVLEEQHVDMEWYSRCISWLGRPEFSDSTSVRWGNWDCGVGSELPVRLTVYYSLEGEQQV